MKGVQWRAVCDDHEGDEVPWEGDREEAEEHAELMRDVLGCRWVRIERREYLSAAPHIPNDVEVEDG